MLDNLKASLIKNPQIQAILNQAYGSLGKQGQANFLQRPDMEKIAPLMQGENAMSFGQAIATGWPDDGGGGGPIFPAMLGAAKAHPFKTAGLVGLGAGNIGGLMDNNKFGGQLGGLALGGLGSYLAGASPYTAAMMTMGGGALGSLFDKLRAKKEQQNQQPYYGGR